jgi:AbrB family looped-hinge helix DNA binding protein
MGAFATIAWKGRLTIPKQVRDELKLTSGTRFHVTVRNGGVVARPMNKRLADLAGILGKPPTGETLTIEQMNEAIMDAVSEDDERILREESEGIE